MQVMQSLLYSKEVRGEVLFCVQKIFHLSEQDSLASKFIVGCVAMKF